MITSDHAWLVPDSVQTWGLRFVSDMPAIPTPLTCARKCKEIQESWFDVMRQEKTRSARAGIWRGFNQVPVLRLKQHLPANDKRIAAVLSFTPPVNISTARHRETYSVLTSFSRAVPHKKHLETALSCILCSYTMKFPKTKTFCCQLA